MPPSDDPLDRNVNSDAPAGIDAFKSPAGVLGDTFEEALDNFLDSVDLDAIADNNDDELIAKCEIGEQRILIRLGRPSKEKGWHGDRRPECLGNRW